MNTSLIPQFRVHTLLAVMAACCVLFAMWRAHVGWMGLVLFLASGLMASGVVRHRRLPPLWRTVYGATLGLVIGMLFVTTQAARDWRFEAVLLTANAVGGACGALLTGRPETAHDASALEPHEQARK